MKKLQSAFQRISFQENSIPLALLFTCILAFGLLVRGLGFYMDDWPYVFYAYNKGIDSLRISLFYDGRPNAAWLYMSAFTLLGFKPLHWHVAMLVLRWLTVILLWMALKMVWPRRARDVTYFAFLFSIYPFFMLQTSAVGSMHHWVGFALFALSLILMIRAVSSSRLRIPTTIGAVLLEGIHLFTSEYFAGLELIRPIILWILISRRGESKRKTATTVLTKSLPYLLMLAFYSFWRIMIFKGPPGAERNVPLIAHQLLHDPLNALWFLFKASLTDAISVLTIGWQRATDVQLFNPVSLFSDFRLLLSIFIFLAIYFYLNRLTFPASESAEDDWPKKAPVLALAALILSGLPVWIVGRTILESKNLISASRFGLPTMLGASLLMVLLISSFVPETKKSGILLAVIIAVALNFHLDHEKGFQSAWKKQIDFYQQLSWRAPQLQPGTAIVTDMEILGYMGQYATSFGINTIYQPGNIAQPKYWYFPVYYTYSDIDRFIAGIPIQDRKLSMEFSGQSTDSLVISFEPERDRCLWVLRPLDQNLRLVSEDMRRLSTVSAIERIGNNNGAERQLPEAIFGRSESEGWCYYFERADLARQYGHWDEVVQLYEQAQAAGQQAGNGFEYIPFIEGYGHLEDWETVKVLTKVAAKISKGLEPSLCDSLDGIRKGVAPSPERDGTILNLKDYLHCVDYQ